MATRCRWPPESRRPEGPTLVAYPSSSPQMKSWATAARAASSHRCTITGSVTSIPSAMFSSTVPSNSKASCAHQHGNKQDRHYWHNRKEVRGSLGRAPTEEHCTHPQPNRWRSVGDSSACRSTSCP